MLKRNKEIRMIVESNAEVIALDPDYFRALRWGFFNFDWRILRVLLGLLMVKVPLPWYSAL
jgi:hypothetical protein